MGHKLYGIYKNSAITFVIILLTRAILSCAKKSGAVPTYRTAKCLLQLFFLMEINL